MKDFSEIEELLVKYVEQLEEEKVIELANQSLENGIDPVHLLDLINEGMKGVGRLYESKDYYIADLIMAGLIFKQVLELDKMSAFFRGTTNRKVGKVILGTVKGDIHDIGKDIFRYMLEAYGFEVIDLGVDVPKEQFIKKVKDIKPNILALSGVLTNTVDEMREVVEACKGAGLRDKVKIIVGANYLTQDSFIYIGADGFAKDASAGAKQCRAWIDRVNARGEHANG